MADRLEQTEAEEERSMERRRKERHADIFRMRLQRIRQVALPVLRGTQHFDTGVSREVLLEIEQVAAGIWDDILPTEEQGPLLTNTY